MLRSLCEETSHILHIGSISSSAHVAARQLQGSQVFQQAIQQLVSREVEVGLAQPDSSCLGGTHPQTAACTLCRGARKTLTGPFNTKLQAPPASRRALSARQLSTTQVRLLHLLASHKGSYPHHQQRRTPALLPCCRPDALMWLPVASQPAEAARLHSNRALCLLKLATAAAVRDLEPAGNQQHSIAWQLAAGAVDDCNAALVCCEASLIHKVTATATCLATAADMPQRQQLLHE